MVYEDYELENQLKEFKKLTDQVAKFYSEARTRHYNLKGKAIRELEELQFQAGKEDTSKTLERAVKVISLMLEDDYLYKSVIEKLS